MVTAERTERRTGFHRGERVRMLREMAGLSQQEFGVRMGGKGQAQISRIEGSPEGFSKVSDIEQAAQILRVPPVYFMDPSLDVEWLDPELAQTLAGMGREGQASLLSALKRVRLSA